MRLLEASGCKASRLSVDRYVKRSDPKQPARKAARDAFGTKLPISRGRGAAPKFGTKFIASEGDGVHVSSFLS